MASGPYLPRVDLTSAVDTLNQAEAAAGACMAVWMAGLHGLRGAARKLVHM